MKKEFKVSDIHLSVDDAFLEAYLDDESLVWSAKIIASGSEFNVSLTKDLLFETPQKVQDIREFSGRSICWNSPHDDDGEPKATLYAFQHSPVYNSKIELMPGSEALWISWTGTTDLFWKEGYLENIPFRVSSPLRFEGIWCGRLSEQEAMLNVSKFYDISKLAASTVNNGVTLMKSIDC